MSRVRQTGSNATEQDTAPEAEAPVAPAPDAPAPAAPPAAAPAPEPQQVVTTPGRRVGTSRVLLNTMRRTDKGETIPPGEYDLDDEEAKQHVAQGTGTYVPEKR
jgi:hypothetical protein